MSEGSADRKRRMAEAVRLVVTRRERAPRSPRMERALKRLIWRYSQRERAHSTENREGSVDVQE
jgi:hypothetical protein